MSAGVVMARIPEAPPRPNARVTGVVYLLYFLTAISGEAFVSKGRVVLYDAVNLISHGFYIAVALLFYYLFKPVNRGVSLLAAFFGLAGCANDVLNLFKLDPYKINSLVFFAPYCLLIGYLILRSTFLPRFLGVLMVLAGLGWLIFASPLARHLATGIMALGILAEGLLMLWLIVMGVNVQRWKEQGGAFRVSGSPPPNEGVRVREDRD